MLLAAVPAGAQTGVEPAGPPRYNVEVIVFAHTDFDPAEERFGDPFDAAGLPAAVGRSAAPIAVDPLGPQRPVEIPADQTVVLDPPNAGAVSNDVAGSDGLPGAPSDDVLDFVDPFGTLGAGLSNAADAPMETAVDPVRLLGHDELTLAATRSVIDRLGAYRLLGHGGWQQPGLDQADAVPFDLARLGIANPSGTVELYLGRFLHVAIDLTYRAEIPASPGIASTDRMTEGPHASADRAFPPYAGRPLAGIALPDRFRLKTERNAIRSGELHYIDHPRFGVLVLVMPAPEPETAGDDDPTVAPSA